MGDGDEIRQLIRKESESFLKHELFLAKGGDGAYDFEAEFAKTRRNKSRVVAVSTAITVLCLAIGVFAATRAIETRASKVQVDVAAFDDLNLRDLLDASKQDDAAMDLAKIRLARLDGDLKAGLAYAERDYLASVESIQALGGAPAEEARRIAEAASTRAAARAYLNAGYAPQAASRRAEMAAVQARIDRYDSRSLARAKASQATLANDRLAFDIEKSQMAKLYEARIADIEASDRRDLAALADQKAVLAAALTSRYNPTFADDRPLPARDSTGASPSAPVAPIYAYLGSAGILDSAVEAGLDVSFSDLKYFSAKLRSVPYLNSVPPALTRIEGAATSAIGTYREALRSAGAALEARDKTIAALAARAAAAEESLGQYRAAVGALARSNRESGYVIDATDPFELIVDLDPSVPIQESSLGYVVRGGEAIARVGFSLRGGGYHVRVAGLRGSPAPRAFDWIFVVAERNPNR